MVRTLADMIDLGDDDDNDAGGTDHTEQLQPGDQIYFLASMTLETSESMAGYQGVQYGKTVTLTSEMLRLNRGRDGRSWILDYVDDVPAQIERWGKQMFGRGPFPKDLPKYPKGSLEAVWAQQAAHDAAARIADDEERAAAKAEIKAIYGIPSTQRSTDYSR